MSEAHPHLVMGAAAGLTVEEVAPFLLSLRSCGYQGDVVLFVDWRLRRSLHGLPMCAGTRLLRQSGLQINFRALYRSQMRWRLWRPVQLMSWTVIRAMGRLPLPPGVRTSLQVLIARRVCTPMDVRFLDYLRFVEAHHYERILLTDVRDVLFQNDPFKPLPPSGLAVSIETLRYTVGTEPRNFRWVAQAYGTAQASKIADNPVSCVGVTYGDSTSIIRYLTLMRREILRLPASAARRGGADTAIHNVLIWSGQLGPVHRLDTLESPVATLNDVREEEIRISPTGRLLNRDGSEPSVLHQYDRLPRMGRRLRQVLAAPRESDPGAEVSAPSGGRGTPESNV